MIVFTADPVLTDDPRAQEARRQAEKQHEEDIATVTPRINQEPDADHLKNVLGLVNP